MSYGTSNYGSSAIAGSTASQWFMFFPFALRDTGDYDAAAEFTGTEQLFSLFFRKSSENTDVSVEAFTRNDLGETPQSQGTFGSGHFAQHVIGSARYISIRATVGAIGDSFEVRGRAGG